MRILHVFDHSLPEQSGYSFRSAAILREERRLGWQTVQVTGPKHARAQAQIETVSGFDFYRTLNRPSLLGRLPVLNQLDVVRQLRTRLREVIELERPDLIHAHSPCLNGLAALGLGKPLVYELRSSWEDAAVSTGTTHEGSLRYRASRALETYVLRRADAVTTICEGLRQEVLRRGLAADRVTVIANAVDVDAINTRPADTVNMRAKLGLDGHCVLGFIGSFFAWEGLPLLIDALPRILLHRPDARVLLGGAGVDEANIRAAVQRNGVEKAVIFAGSLPHSAVGALYDAVDVLVYPRVPIRLTEMVTPLKPLEAMAQGKAFIASDVGGHRELIAPDMQEALFRAGDASALAARVLAIIDDAGLKARLIARGAEHVRRERTWGTVVPRYQPVYERLLRGGSA